MPPFVHLFINRQGLLSLRSLGDADGCSARIHLFGDPIAVEGLVGEQRVKRQAMDQGRDAHGVVAIAGQQDEPNEVSERICESQYLGPSHRLLANDYRAMVQPPFDLPVA